MGVEFVLAFEEAVVLKDIISHHPFNCIDHSNFFLPHHTATGA